MTRSSMSFTWGLEHRTLESIRAIGVDEIQYAKGHKYLTLVYQIDQGFTRLLWVGKERTIESFQGFFTVIGARTRGSDPVCLLRYVAALPGRDPRECPQALHILDRFHIVAKMNKALDEVRAAEARQLARGGSRAGAEEIALVRAEAQRESHRHSNSSACAICSATTSNRPRLPAQGGLPAVLEIQLATLGRHVPGLLVLSNHAQAYRAHEENRPHLRKHRALLLNYFKARKQFSSGVVEGLNNKAKVTMRRSYGFRTFRVLELALYHSLGKLPEPELTHEFF